MAKQTINSNSTEPLGLPNTGDGTEFGDKWNAAVTKINAMFTEVYAGTAATSAGGGAATFKDSGNISVQSTTIGSSATNTTQTMFSYSLPASTLNATGQELIIAAWGRKANNAAPVTFQLNFGGASINSGAVATSGGISWTFNGEVLKSGSNTQQVFFTGQTAATAIACKSTSDTSTDTGAIVISLQVLDASAAQSNVLLDGFVVEFFG